MSDTSYLPLRPELVGEEPYGAPQLPAQALLNVNENPYPPSPELVKDIAAAVAEAAGSLNRYPDREFPRLRSELAAYLSEESAVELPWQQIWAANGSNEVMSHILAAFAGPGRKVAAFTPSYSMYPEYVRNAHATWIEGPREEDFTVDVDKVSELLAAENPAVLFLASPNNPTGTALPVADIAQICQLSRGSGPDGADCLVVVDEAYAEFRRDGVASALELLATNRNLIVSRTMSKAFGAAGLRLGYCAASTEIIDKLRIVRLPYHLSAVTQATALAALKHRGQLREQVALMRRHRDELAAELLRRGFQVAPSDANFLMFGTFADRDNVWQGLLDLGVLIRQVGPPGWLRVSIGTEAENRLFSRALKEVTGK